MTVYHVLRAIDTDIHENIPEARTFRLLRDYATYLALPEVSRLIISILGNLPVSPVVEALEAESGLSSTVFRKALRALEFEKFVRLRGRSVEVLPPLAGLLVVFEAAGELEARSKSAARGV